jgi:hypothetical protein
LRAANRSTAITPRSAFRVPDWLEAAAKHSAKSAPLPEYHLSRQQGFNRRDELQRAQRQSAHRGEGSEIDGEKTCKRIGCANRHAPVKCAPLRKET